ncbi:MAG: hypothetical protein QXR62_05615 [Candidatus Bathyarchaeia archaeon]|nr:hypothetical protein [Candidatus Bathyarchaeota archaeon]
MSAPNESQIDLVIEGRGEFREKVQEALNLIRAAGYYEILREHIRCIKEINGLTQLRVSEATIWANKYAVEDPVDAAGRFIQEAYYMKMQAEGEKSHEGIMELKAFEKRIEFLKKLMEISRDDEVKKRCERLIKMWDESLLIY